MPENTVDQIAGGKADDGFSEMREEAATAPGVLEQLANVLGISPAKIATALGSMTPGKSKLNATCPQCSQKYKYFSDEAYTEDQSTCPACRDEALAPQREMAMRPEKMDALKRVRDEQAKAEATKEQTQRETVELVARTVAELLPQLQKADK